MSTPAYEKHTLVTDALDVLGTLIGPDVKRDAIHLAVEPVVAGAALRPGEHVIYDDDGQAVPAAVGCGIGIVDPFIEAEWVQPGDRFLLVVYPRRITSLRHVWEHPDFAPSEIALYAETRAVDVEGERAKAEVWLRKNLDDKYSTDVSYGDSESFDSLIAKIADCDGSVTVRGGDDHGTPIPQEVFDKVAVYLGRPIDTPTDATFECSC